MKWTLEKELFQILEAQIAPQKGSELKNSPKLTVCMAGDAALRPPEKDRKSINV